MTPQCPPAPRNHRRVFLRPSRRADIVQRGNRPEGVEGAARPPIGRVLVSVSSIGIISALPVFLVGGLGVQIKAELGLSEAAFGAAFSAFFLLGVLLSSPLGRWLDGRGTSVGLRIAALISSAAMLGIAAFARSWPTLVVTLAIGGVALTISEPAANRAVALSVPVRRQGIGLGIKQAAYPGAGVLSGLAVPLLGVTLGWRWSLVCAAGIAAVAALLPPRDGRTAPVPRPKGPLETDRLTMLLLAAAVAFGSSGSSVFGAFLVSSAVATGFSEGQGGVLLAVATAGAIPLRLLAGSAVDRPGRRPLPMSAALAAAGAFGYVLLATGSGLVFMIGAALAFSCGWGWVGAFNVAVVRLNPGSPAAATGITQTGVYAGALISPVVFGLIVDNASFRVAWAVIAINLLAAAACLVGAQRSVNHHRGDQPTVRPPSTA